MTDCVCESACNVLQTAAAAPHAACGWAPSANPPCLLLGVLASDVRLAVRALRDFCAALGSEFLLPEPDVRPPSLASPPTFECLPTPCAWLAEILAGGLQSAYASCAHQCSAAGKAQLLRAADLELGWVGRMGVSMRPSAALLKGKAGRAQPIIPASPQRSLHAGRRPAPAWPQWRARCTSS